MRLYVARTIYVASLLGLVVTAWLILIGSQQVANLGDWARFGAKVFQILAPLQLAVATLLSALVTAAAVAQEKDRRTLVLLLLSRLSNGELVMGKLLASMLNVLVMIATALPLFMLLAMLGGVSYGQIARVFAVTFASALLAGSLGSTISLWREKTFQSLAMTVLGLVLWVGAWELVAAGAVGESVFSVSATRIAETMSPWQAILAASRPDIAVDTMMGWLASPGTSFVLAAVLMVVLLNGMAIALVRVWNPSREVLRLRRDTEDLAAVFSENHQGNETDQAALAATPARQQRKVRTRRVWDNPILWREIRTWAYGKRIVVVRLAYVALFAASALAVWGMTDGHFGGMARRALIPEAARPTIPLFIVSVLLVNALAVTALTTERDGKALDLLLVTDLSPKEFIFGKLGGVFYNAKEMVLLPLALCLYLWSVGLINGLNLTYLMVGLAVIFAFAAMLGIHSGITYANSRIAIGTSLGTLLFLLLGVATCMRMMVAFQGSFVMQLPPFLGFMIGGGAAMFLALGWRNPSRALMCACLLAPFFTFYVITSFLLGHYGWMVLVVAAVYGGATAAMLVPAVSEFDVATGRTGGGEA